MSLEQFRQLAKEANFRNPAAEWSVRWMQRMCEFFKHPVDQPLPVDAGRLIEFLKSMRDKGVATWQRHQAAISAGRYMAMQDGHIDLAVQDIIRRLADFAAARPSASSAQGADD